eukprot:1633222-Pyramimonas_sp.AAC.1
MVQLLPEQGKGPRPGQGQGQADTCSFLGDTATRARSSVGQTLSWHRAADDSWIVPDARAECS